MPTSRGTAPTTPRRTRSRGALSRRPHRHRQRRLRRRFQRRATQWPTGTDPLQIADWAWHVFNADLDMLERHRGTLPGEADFLIAAVYRLMRRRSLSVGDVVSITADGVVTWLACESFGWRQITAPAATTGAPLTAEAVYRHASGGSDDQ